MQGEGTLGGGSQAGGLEEQAASRVQAECRNRHTGLDQQGLSTCLHCQASSVNHLGHWFTLFNLLQLVMQLYLLSLRGQDTTKGAQVVPSTYPLLALCSIKCLTSAYSVYQPNKQSIKSSIRAYTDLEGRFADP